MRALESAGKNEALPTSAILSKASALSGEKIPYYSLYQALRTLVRRRQLAAHRRGRELVYRLAATPPKSTPAARPRGRPRTIRSSPTAPATSSAVRASTPASAGRRGTPATPVTTGAATLHKIAPGEIAFLHVGESHVEIATNIGGKLVLRKHPRPG
jgi:hypothetical protein